MRVSPELEARDGGWMLLKIILLLIHHYRVYKDNGTIEETNRQYLEIIIKILQLDGSNFVGKSEHLA